MGNRACPEFESDIKPDFSSTGYKNIVYRKDGDLYAGRPLAVLVGRTKTDPERERVRPHHDSIIKI